MEKPSTLIGKEGNFAIVPGGLIHPIVFLIAGLIFVTGPCIVDGRVPGFLDNRFNNYALEHFYRWVTFKDHSFWNGDFFFPFPLTTAFSENHFGTGLFYLPFRIIGCDPEDAFRGWYVLGYILNFASATFALRRLGRSYFGSSCGAFLFSFAMPIAMQGDHSQLLYRFAVPLAVLSLLEFARDKKLLLFVWFAVWTTLQFYFSIYTGFFLVLLLAAIVITLLILPEKGERKANLVLLHPLLYWSKSPLSTNLVFVMGLTVSAMLMAALGFPYFWASKIYGFTRDWPSVFLSLPRPISYFLNDSSPLWFRILPLTSPFPLRGENQLFIGVSPYLALIGAILLVVARRGLIDRTTVRFAVAISIVVAWTLNVDAHTLYYAFFLLPGVDSIRAVSRIIVILLFPMGCLFAASLDTIAAASYGRWVKLASVGAIALGSIIEASAAPHVSLSKEALRARLAEVRAKLPEHHVAEPILVVGPDSHEPTPYPRLVESYMREMDGMVVAQDLGWRTLNGYSGNLPPGHENLGLCSEITRDLVEGINFLHRPIEPTYREFADDIVAVDYPNCAKFIAGPPPLKTTFAGALPLDMMAKIDVKIDDVSVLGDRIRVAFTVTNNSKVVLPALSSTGQPVRLVARYVTADSHQPMNPATWDLVQNPNSSVPPGATKISDIALPTPPHEGDFRVTISFVQQAVGWFQDQGMPLPVSHQTIHVGKAIEVSDQ
jgi:hypothetical protein